MKCISVFILCAAAMSAADFTNGQAARLVIGQTTFTSQDPNSSDTIIGGVSGLAYAADTLFVADSNQIGAAPSNNRVLLFGSLSSQLPSPTAELPYDRKCPVCVGQATVVLGQPDFTTTTENLAASQNNLRQPTAVASDGVHLVVADTNHNRVLIWNRIPTTNNAPADVVVGQPDFVSSGLPSGNTPTAKSMRGPQGVWIQNGKLYVADTQNNRVLIYNQIPTSNGAAADVVLGEPNFTTAIQPNLAAQTTSATASNLLNPVAVSSDGTHLFVTDLGYNRILIWNSIPTTNAAPADVEIGQPDMVSSVANNSYSGTAATSTSDTTDKETPVLCTVSNGVDGNSNPTYPEFCNYTVSFPRFTLAVGNRLFVADGGNDRLMVFNQIPTQNAQPADYIIGHLGGTVTQAPDSADSLQTPMSMAWDGTNLYVSDTYNRPHHGLFHGREHGSLPGCGQRRQPGYFCQRKRDHQRDDPDGRRGHHQHRRHGQYRLLGQPDHHRRRELHVHGEVHRLVHRHDQWRGGQRRDRRPGCRHQQFQQRPGRSQRAGQCGYPRRGGAFDRPDVGTEREQYHLFRLGRAFFGQQRRQGRRGDGGLDPDRRRRRGQCGGGHGGIDHGHQPFGRGARRRTRLRTSCLTTWRAPRCISMAFGRRCSRLSPTQITAQVPWEVNDTTSVNAFVRSVQSDGSVVVTTPVAVTIVPQNPGIYSQSGTPDPVLPSATVGLVYHGSNRPSGWFRWTARPTPATPPR